MEYVELGKTKRKVSRIGFGGATAGIPNYLRVFDANKANDREPIAEAIKRAYELGITYFDTAQDYGDGTSEEIFGEGLTGIPPEKIFLATKATPFASGKVREPGEVRSSLEGSLKRLRRDYVDLIQIHGSYYSAEDAREILKPGGIADVLEQARKEGLAKHIGYTIEAQNTALDLFIESERFDCMQIEYNLIFQHPYDPSFECGSLYDAEKTGIGIVAMRTVTSGIFQKWVQMVNPANTFNYTPSLVQFVLSNPFIDVALIGMRTVEEVEENAAICNNTNERISLWEIHNRRF
jgi:aryl-alcohol dehydrogenase-like predicted oxidoreductase